MNILITGSAGYIGSHLSLMLKKQGHYTIGIDNFCQGKKEHVFNDVFFKGTYYSSDILHSIFSNTKIDLVIHLAAHATVSESFKDPDKYMYNNVRGVDTLLYTMSCYDIKNIIFSSTCCVYDDCDSAIQEHSFIRPMNPYGYTKYMAEMILQYYKLYYDINYIIFRYFNVAGSDKKLRTGELHDPETHLIPNVIKAALTNKPVNIYGMDYDTIDGTCVRDYIHVNDICQAHIDAMDYIQKDNKINVFNLGTGIGYSVMEIINEVNNIKKVATKKSKKREGDPPIRIASYDKAKEVLGWKPTHGLKQIISSAYKFFEKEME